MEKETTALERLSRRRVQLSREADECAAEIRKHWETLFTPPPADTKVQGWMAQVERAVAVYDGVVTGYKLMKRLGAFLPNKSRSRRAKRDAAVKKRSWWHL